ncbi:MAG TPA: IPT/TIG domain-containing protein, partial [Acidimicrobiia bacterium]|nr:IPT/TIG domain-containing protein [Acidimicrobiia bacterium]
MDLRIRNTARSNSGRRRRRFVSLGALVSLVTAGLVAVAFSAAAATTNGDPVTWSQVECIAQVGSGTLGTPIDITVAAVVQNQVSASQSYTNTIPGGTATLPSASNGFTIGSYNNLNQTYLFRSSAGSPQVTSATAPATATNNGNSVPYNVTFTNEGTSAAISAASWVDLGGGTITYTTTAAHPFTPGQLIDITGNLPATYNFSGVVVASVPSSTTFTIHGNSISTSSGTWSASPSPTLTYTTAFPNGVKVGDVIQVVNATPIRYTGKKTVSAVLSPTSFQVLDTSGNPDPGPITVQGQVDTIANPGNLSATHGSVKSLTTVTNSTPSANPGTLTTPDTTVTMTAPSTNATVTSYGAVVLTTANLVGPGPAATSCNLPHAVPQTDGISATLTGTGGPTTTATPTCRPTGSVCTPIISSVSPSSGPTAGGTSVTISGFDFTGTTAVNFGATPATTFTVNSSTSITATAPAGTAGTVDITATDSAGTSSTSTADQFTYVGAPTVTSVSPTSGPAAGGTSVTITGTGFTGATAVNFGATAATTFTVNNATTITATSPAHSAGAVDVTVTTPNGTSATSANDQFTFVAAPTVTSVSPTSGPAAGGTSVTITGTGFTGATAVNFGAAAATTFTVNNATSITATSPAHSAGTVDTTVTTPGGTSATSAADQFTFLAAPTVTSVSPTSGPAAGGTSVTITGTGFTGATAVNFGATAATTFTVNNATSITATSPAHSTGTVDITVTTPGGTSATSANDQFTF